jgi:hypothetical protein
MSEKTPGHATSTSTISTTEAADSGYHWISLSHLSYARLILFQPLFQPVICQADWKYSCVGSNEIKKDKKAESRQRIVFQVFKTYHSLPPGLVEIHHNISVGSKVNLHVLKQCNSGQKGKD